MGLMGALSIVSGITGVASSIFGASAKNEARNRQAQYEKTQNNREIDLLDINAQQAQNKFNEVKESNRERFADFQGKQTVDFASRGLGGISVGLLKAHSKFVFDRNQRRLSKNASNLQKSAKIRQDALKDKIKYGIASAKRAGRNDWIEAGFGVINSIAGGAKGVATYGLGSPSSSPSSSSFKIGDSLNPSLQSYAPKIKTNYSFGYN